MNAVFPAPYNGALVAEVDLLIRSLADAQARKRIAEYWLTGWILGDDAMELLVGLGLIEHLDLPDE